jgi:carboxymethylenebutenolidase
MSDVTIRAADGGSFSGYLATPKSGKGPGILVIQEIFGVNKVMRDITDGFAAQGYVALCPDLFWRQEPGIQLTDKTEAEWARAFQLYQGFDEAKGVDDLKATLAHLRGLPACTGKGGSVGYCLGGKLAYLMSARTTIDCSVSYYGVAIDAALNEASKIKKPLMLHVAEDDQFVPHDVQDKMVAVLGKNPLVTMHKYPGVNHAFAREGGKNYDADSARVANKRTSDFLLKHIYS